AVYCYATRSQGRLRTLLVGVLAVAAIATSLLATDPSQAPLGAGASALTVTAAVATGRYPGTPRIVLVPLQQRAEQAEPALAVAAIATALLAADASQAPIGVGASAMTVTGAVATGMYTGARRILLGRPQQRAEQAESGRAVAQEQARRAERTRIAREMHDVVPHKISLVAMHAGALEVNPQLARAKVQESAPLIRETATTALSELREVLGVLRGDGEDAPLAPQPTWEDVRKLVTVSQAAGITVELFDFIDDPVP